MGGWLDLLRGVMGEQCGRTEGIMDGMTRWDVGSRRKSLYAAGVFRLPIPSSRTSGDLTTLATPIPAVRTRRQ